MGALRFVILWVKPNFPNLARPIVKSLCELALPDLKTLRGMSEKALEELNRFKMVLLTAARLRRTARQTQTVPLSPGGNVRNLMKISPPDIAMLMLHINYELFSKITTNEFF